MNDDRESDFAADVDIMDVLNQHFPPPPDPRNTDDLPKIKAGETLSALDEIPTTVEAHEPAETVEPPKCGSVAKK